MDKTADNSNCGFMVKSVMYATKIAQAAVTTPGEFGYLLVEIKRGVNDED